MGYEGPGIYRCLHDGRQYNVLGEVLVLGTGKRRILFMPMFHSPDVFCAEEQQQFNQGFELCQKRYA